VGALKLPPFKYLLDFLQSEVVLWSKFADLPAKRVSVSLFSNFEEKPIGQVKGGTLPLGSSQFHGRQNIKKKPGLNRGLGPLCAAFQRNIAWIVPRAIFAVQARSLRKKAELRKWYEVDHLARADLLDLLRNLD
jgi:hypothetical protein